jgi:uncharacterized protein YjbI with pentapeptide repeats
MLQTLKKYLLYAGAVLILCGLTFVLAETVKAKSTGFETKTLWDWMELLIIPLFLAGGAFYLNRSERETEHLNAEKRVKLEREIATDRQQEAALQAYLDRMAELLLANKLLTTKDKEVRNVARIRTLTVLEGLDGLRKGLLLRFLQEAELIDKQQPMIDLSRANLSDTVLTVAELTGANLHELFLRRAKLGWINLSGANLSISDLQDADLLDSNLSGADLSGANLSGVNLKGVNLSNANLTRAIVTAEQLALAKSLHGATMPDGIKHE